MTFLCHWLDPENPEAIDAPTPAEAAELCASNAPTSATAPCRPT